jgi:hypothetical protein
MSSHELRCFSYLIFGPIIFYNYILEMVDLENEHELPQRGFPSALNASYRDTEEEVYEDR